MKRPLKLPVKPRNTPARALVRLRGGVHGPSDKAKRRADKARLKSGWDLG